MDISVILLAAGKGTRMKSETVKVLHPIAGRPMLAYSLELACELDPLEILVVVGFQADRVRGAFPETGLRVRWVLQPEQKGTADAVRCALPYLKQTQGTVLVHYGDVPLLRKETLLALLEEHRRSAGPLTFLTAHLENPAGYGRIVRDAAGTFLRIVEEADATPQEKALREVNTGIACIEIPFLHEALDRLQDDNAQKEFYLTDLAAYTVSQGLRVGSLVTGDAFRALGINTRKDLSEAERCIRRSICDQWMLAGVTIEDPRHTYIDATVTLEPDVRIGPNCHLRGHTRVGGGSVIDTGAVITDATIGKEVLIRPYSVIQESEIHDRAVVGPMAHLRPGTVLEKGVRVGNFVEVKKSRLGERSKASHLTYLGDSDIGKDVNVGCGTITCNYDGVAKHRTIIEDEAFIGSDTQLVAPVRIGRGAYVGSGSTITRDVPPASLAVSRARQKVIEGWAASKGKKRKKS